MLENFPYIKREDVLAALAFAAAGDKIFSMNLLQRNENSSLTRIYLRHLTAPLKMQLMFTMRLLKLQTIWAIWNFAKENGHIIITKDSDFLNLSRIFGQPPKVIYIKTGNCRNRIVLNFLEMNRDLISGFATNDSPLLYLS